jgi:hypothetical protein
MTRRLCLLLAVVLSCGLIAAGCGGDDDDGGDGGGGDGGGVAAPENRQQAVDACKRSVDQAPQLSSDVKSELKKSCEAAAEGDEEAVAEANRKVCVKIAQETIPAGPARDQAVDGCERAGQQR